MKKSRFGIVVTFFGLFFVLIIIRLVFVTLFPDERLKSKSMTPMMRGKIYDRHHNELAFSSTFYSLYARPDIMQPDLKQYIYNELLQKSDISKQNLARFYENKPFIWIKRKISPNGIVFIEKLYQYLRENELLKRDEIGIVRESGRFYPNITVTPVVGLVGIDNHGLAGLEYTYNSYLDEGYDIVTTLDAKISSIAYEELKKGVIENQAEYGSVTIIDIKTREILAIVSYPSYDPNDFTTLNQSNINSAATAYIFEPGSVMKQFTAAFALSKQYNTPFYPTYDCNKAIQIADHTFDLPYFYGTLDLSRIIQKSCNVGMIQVAEKFNRREFSDFLRSFGFGERPPLPLNDLQSGLLAQPENWSVLTKYMVSIGQEIAVNSVQLAVATSVIAGGGVYKTPSIIKRISKDDGQNIYNIEMVERRVISEENASDLLRMMQTVVSEDGTALLAKVEGVAIAGKTGTAQIAKAKGGGYYESLFNAVFTGYVPGENPKLSVIVVINKPKGGKHQGGQVAAPIFADIVRRIITSTDYFLRNP